MISKLSNVLTVAGTYQGRDKIVRLLTYILYFLRGKLQKNENIELKLSILIRELSNLRVMLRLFDDIFMLQFSISYGLGGKEKDHWCRYLQLFKNLADQLYYPVEHIAWARDVKILKGNSDKLWNFGCILWVVSLTMGILKSARLLWMLMKEKKCLQQSLKESKSLACQVCVEKREACSCKMILSSTEDTGGLMQQISGINCRRKYLIIGLIENFADIINGINWLPKGFLWASKMSSQSIGIFGTISSLCQLYKQLEPGN